MRVSAAVLLWVVWAALPVGGAAPAEGPARVLSQNGIEPTARGVIDFLGRCRPDPQRAARLGGLIAELGSGSFQQRQQALRELESYGDAALPALRQASESADPEVKARATRLLEEAARGQVRRRHEARLSAALRFLREKPAAEAVPVLLEILPALPEPALRPALCEALWACAAREHGTLLRRALAEGDGPTRAAVIPALEAALGAEAVELLRPCLQDKSEPVRLAAARALVDRLPRPAVAALVELLASSAPAVRAQAAGLLRQVSGIPGEKEGTIDFAAAAARWKGWAEDTQKPVRPLGAARFSVAVYGALLTESFAESGAIGKGYRQFAYESTLPAAAAAVEDGMLRLDGQHEEGDQRLFVTAEKLVGLPTFPRQIQVKAKLGGEAAGSGSWHVGVSLGNVRVLFHPELQGGGFRAERVDNHQFLFDNETLPFTPAGGVLHEMTITARQRDNGAVDLSITLVDGNDAAKSYSKELTVKAEDIGPLQRIGLERSGRTGGAALFGALSVTTDGSSGP